MAHLSRSCAIGATAVLAIVLVSNEASDPFFAANDAHRAQRVLVVGAVVGWLLFVAVWLRLGRRSGCAHGDGKGG
ncbi:hypothetical protein MASR2M8_24140 [Opitutaceae bacterium]